MPPFILRIARIAIVALSTTAAAAAPDCTPQTQVDPKTIDRQVVLVGEVHGTAEIPRFTLGLVCSLLGAGRAVILGVEHSGEQQAALNAYLESDGGPGDRRELLRGVNWQDYDDGRGSVAMLDLVEGMRRLRREGYRVAILAIDRNENVDVPPEDDEQALIPPLDNALLNRIGNQSMANNVLYAATLYRKHTVVVLSGYLHTSTVPSTHDARYGDYAPMGQLIAARLPVFTIGIETAGGEHAGTGPVGSGTYAVAPGALYVDSVAVDAKVRLGRVTASPPARDAVR